jgi:hypothetical protein
MEIGMITKKRGFLVKEINLGFSLLVVKAKAI